MISQEIKTLLSVIKNYTCPSYLVAKTDETTLEVGTITSKAAQYYEKARYVVDYKEEHLLRRAAIERILRRRLTIEITPEKNSHSFLMELIQAGYLPNRELPERVTTYVQVVIDKTIFFSTLLKHTYSPTDYSNFKKRIISLATLEIEYLLFPSTIDEAILKALYEKVKKHISITKSHLSILEKDTQIYLACRRGFFKEEDTTLFYRLWIMHYPEWNQLNSANEKNDNQLKDIAEEFAKINKLIEKQVKNTLHIRLVPKLKNDVIYFSALRKIIKENQETVVDILENSEQFNSLLKESLEKEYSSAQKRIKKNTWRAIIYILITKVILAIILEAPYDYFILEKINYLTLAINILFPPLLLFAITTSVTKPDKKNTDKIIKGVNSIVYTNNHSEIFLAAKRTRGMWQGVALFLYLMVFVLSFSVILWVLDLLDFNFVGILLFLLFLTFVSYFGLRVRFIARRWTVQTDEQKFLIFLWDMITLPIISLGQWLVIKFASVNVFVFIMDFIIEAPFKVVLKALDTLILFVKEKKDEMY